jgi:hypothetical protein
LSGWRDNSVVAEPQQTYPTFGVGDSLEPAAGDPLGWARSFPGSSDISQPAADAPHLPFEGGKAPARIGVETPARYPRSSQFLRVMLIPFGGWRA